MYNMFWRLLFYGDRCIMEKIQLGRMTDSMIFITGDVHGHFKRIEEFCRCFSTNKKDILIILGDAGINSRGWIRDREKKDFLETLPVTLFCIHGNHEQRPQTIPSYGKKIWRGGTVFYEKEYPHLLFGRDGDIFDFDGKQTIVIGGAFSIDKMYRISHGYNWWKDEQPSEEVRAYTERRLSMRGWTIDVVLSHTAPLKYVPREAFHQGIDQSRVDQSTEIWLDQIEKQLNYKKWYCGHFHTKKRIDRIEIMFENYDVFGTD